MLPVWKNLEKQNDVTHEPNRPYSQTVITESRSGSRICSGIIHPASVLLNGWCGCGVTGHVSVMGDGWWLVMVCVQPHGLHDRRRRRPADAGADETGRGWNGRSSTLAGPPPPVHPRPALRSSRRSICDLEPPIFNPQAPCQSAIFFCCTDRITMLKRTLREPNISRDAGIFFPKLPGSDFSGRFTPEHLYQSSQWRWLLVTDLMLGLPSSPVDRVLGG